MLIQIVDDSRNMRETIKSALAVLEAEFIESGDGDDAVLQFASRRPDVVIMDIRMEGMDGIEATHAIRRVSPTARVVILTQYNDTALRTAARDAGAVGYVLKDDLSVLQTVVSSLP